MIISVASGKGGTGKTLVATSLALTLKDRYNVQLLDCDVEEPNDHIFMKPDIIRSKAVSIPVFLAGGINPENVEKAITEVRPYGVDLCSGVEASKGKKDPDKLRNLIENIRSATENLS